MPFRGTLPGKSLHRNRYHNESSTLSTRGKHTGSKWQTTTLIFKRPRWLRECMAEATGVFFYVYENTHRPVTYLTANRVQFPWYCFCRRLRPECHQSIGCGRLQQHLPDRLGLRPGHYVRDYHLRSNFRRSLQPGHYDMLCHLARLPLEKGPILYLLSSIWVLHRGLVVRGNVLGTDPGVLE